MKTFTTILHTLAVRVKDLATRLANLVRKSFDLESRSETISPRSADLVPRSTDLEARAETINRKSTDLVTRSTDLRPRLKTFLTEVNTIGRLVKPLYPKVNTK